SSTSPVRRLTRTLRPSPSTLCEIRVRRSSSPETSITFDTWMGASRSAIPPLMFRCGFGLVWRLMKPTPCTITRFFSRMTFRTLPRFPASLPEITSTRSFFFSRIFIGCTLFALAMALQHLRGERDDLHELLVPELAGHGAEHAGAHRLPRVVDEHRRVAVES